MLAIFAVYKKPEAHFFISNDTLMNIGFSSLVLLLWLSLLIPKYIQILRVGSGPALHVNFHEMNCYNPIKIKASLFRCLSLPQFVPKLIDFKLGRYVADEPRMCPLCNWYSLDTCGHFTLQSSSSAFLGQNTDCATLPLQPTLWLKMWLHVLWG